MSCIHEFKLLRSSRWSKQIDSTHYKYIRMDTFYCKKCLKYETVKQEEVTDKFANSNVLSAPDWYKEGLW
jgi:hypothetical protein